jgi:DNA-binding protein H-NS
MGGLFVLDWIESVNKILWRYWGSDVQGPLRMNHMKQRQYEAMPLDDLWALRESIVNTLASKIETQKRELERRLADLGRGFAAHPPVTVRQRRPYPLVKPKFKNPTDPSETWSGRGKPPRWISAYLKAGKSMEEFRIAGM